MARQGNKPDRRIVRESFIDDDGLRQLADRLVYVGSAHHKRFPGDYGFHPPVSPRPWKSMCDGERRILKTEAEELFRSGILAGMFSSFDFAGGSQPKYVWCVDSAGEAYEAKIGHDGYHGYRLENDDDMRLVVLKEWKKRCRVD